MKQKKTSSRKSRIDELARTPSNVGDPDPWELLKARFPWQPEFLKKAQGLFKSGSPRTFSTTASRLVDARLKQELANDFWQQTLAILQNPNITAGQPRITAGGASPAVTQRSTSAFTPSKSTSTSQGGASKSLWHGQQPGWWQHQPQGTAPQTSEPQDISNVGIDTSTGGARYATNTGTIHKAGGDRETQQAAARQRAKQEREQRLQQQAAARASRGQRRIPPPTNEDAYSHLNNIFESIVSEQERLPGPERVPRLTGPAADSRLPTTPPAGQLPPPGARRTGTRPGRAALGAPQAASPTSDEDTRNRTTPTAYSPQQAESGDIGDWIKQYIIDPQMGDLGGPFAKQQLYKLADDFSKAIGPNKNTRAGRNIFQTLISSMVDLYKPLARDGQQGGYSSYGTPGMQRDAQGAPILGGSAKQVVDRADSITNARDLRNIVQAYLTQLQTVNPASARQYARELRQWATDVTSGQPPQGGTASRP